MNHTPTHLETPPPPGLAAALAFLKHLAWPIYHAAPYSKKPLWEGYQKSATTEVTQLQRWWKKEAHANPMCLVQPPWCILDVDVHNAHTNGLRSLEALIHQYGPLPPTWCDWTRDGGYHAYFRIPDGVTLPPRTTRLAPGLELLGPGHELTIPGFVHACGHTNEWDEFCHPGTMDAAELPRWMLHYREPTRRAKPLPQPKDPSPYGESLVADLGQLHAGQTEGTKAADQGTTHPTARHGGNGGGQDSLPHPPPKPWKGTAEEAAALLREPVIVGACLRYLAGLLGRSAPTVGHSFLAWFRHEDHASAVFMPCTPEHPNVLYYDFGAVTEHGIPEKAQTLPAVLYRLINGVWPGSLPPSSFLVWAAQLLVESGAVQAVDAHFPALPPGAPPEAIRIYEGAKRLARARSILARAPGGDEAEMPYSESFAAAWCGISERHAHSGLLWCISKGVFWFRRFRKKLAYFVRGTKRLIASLVHAPIATNQKAAVRANELAQEALAREAAPHRRPGQGAGTEAVSCGQDHAPATVPLDSVQPVGACTSIGKGVP